MSSDRTPCEHTPSEHSPSESAYSADQSGYITSRPRRRPSNNIERDPYEEDQEVSSVARTRSPPPTRRGPRVITTARKSVPIPRSVRFTNPTGEIGESSRQGAQTGTTQVVTGVPIHHPPGMNAHESRWVSMMSQDIRFHEERLNQQNQTLNRVMGVLNTLSEMSDRTMRVIAVTQREIRTLRMYLTWTVGALVVMLGVLILSLAR